VQDRALHIAINLCADDIKTGRFQPIVTDALQKSGIHAEQIWLEATERGLMDIASARKTLNRARALGHSTAIDDFGTGYSSLQYLQDLPMDALKIDRSFVNTIGTASVSSPVISHIIEMAKSLNFFIVAEGVETQAQADFLLARGVDFAQGWLYAKALPLDKFMAFYLKAKNERGAGPKVIQTAR
jgi:sensor c-di-GMP phosphodiesterase-like protein